MFNKSKLQPISEDYKKNVAGDYGKVEKAWFVGAYKNHSAKDFTNDFISEGRWENIYEEKFSDKVNQVKTGDKIVIKSTYTKKTVPFIQTEIIFQHLA